MLKIKALISFCYMHEGRSYSIGLGETSLVPLAIANDLVKNKMAIKIKEKAIRSRKKKIEKR